MAETPSTPGTPGPAGSPGERPATFDRHMVLDQLGGWRGMIDVSLPTVAFVVANSLSGLTVGIWAALVAAVLVFGLRLLRRETVQQAVSGLIGVAVAVFIARQSGEARDFFVLGLIRNAGIGVVLLGSILVRWPLVGVAAEFLAPSHLGSMSGHSVRDALRARRTHRPDAERVPDATPRRHWRQDPRVVRAYTWLTVLWAGTFLLRAAVQGWFYWRDDVALLGTSSLVLGLPLTGVALLVTLWAVARLHRHRGGDVVDRPGEDPQPA